MAETGSKPTKTSYTIPCSSAFRAEALRIADKRGVNVGDLARSVLLMTPPDLLQTLIDPGGPPPGDREEVTLKSGPSAGRPWRRKPRLQVRMAPGYDPVTIRRALGLIIAMERGDVQLSLDAPHTTQNKPSSERTTTDPEDPAHPRPVPADTPNMSAIEAQMAEERSESQAKLAHLAEEADRLRAVLSILSFDPLPQGVTSRPEALHVLGFAPGSYPPPRDVKSRFRTLAQIFHPDGPYGDHARMSQVNAAMDLLRRP